MATKYWSCLLTRYEAFVCVICDLVCCYDLRLSCCQSAQFLRCERRGARTGRATLCCHTSSQRRGMNWAHCASSAVSLCLAAALNASCLCFNLWMERDCHQPSSQARHPGQCHPLLDIIDRYLHIIDTYIDRRYTSLSIIRQRKEALLFVAVR